MEESREWGREGMPAAAVVVVLLGVGVAKPVMGAL